MSDVCASTSTTAHRCRSVKTRRRLHLTKTLRKQFHLLEASASIRRHPIQDDEVYSLCKGVENDWLLCLRTP